HLGVVGVPVLLCHSGVAGHAAELLAQAALDLGAGQQGDEPQGAGVVGIFTLIGNAVDVRLQAGSEVVALIIGQHAGSGEVALAQVLQVGGLGRGVVNDIRGHAGAELGDDLVEVVVHGVTG